MTGGEVNIITTNTRPLFAAGLTFYNPAERAIRNLENYLTAFDMVFVFDNSDTSDRKREEALAKLGRNPKFIYLNGHGNQGLPIAYNAILEHPLLTRMDFLCTLDQDSQFEAIEIAKFEKFLIDNFDEIINDVGILGPIIDYGDKRISRDYCSQRPVADKRYVITSGAFVNLAIVREKNLRYDEHYFIDRFDADFCMQMRRQGVRVIQYSGSTLHQSLGEIMASGRTGHSTLRHYYIYRNRFYFNKKWFSPPKRWALDVMQTMRHWATIILSEDEKREKLRVFLLALRDYKTKNFGSR